MKRLFAAIALGLLLATPAFAEGQPPANPFAGAPAEPSDKGAVPLYGDKNPGTPTDERWTIAQPQGSSVRNVSYPTLLPVLPRPGKANGAAIVVAPGGGFVGLSYEHEGLRVARIMAAKGYSAFVLKYRLIPTPADMAGFGKVAMEVISKGISDPDHVMDHAYAPSIEDGIAAIAWVRGNADRYRIDPKRVGIIGFSAGAMTAVSTALTAKEGEKPDFSGYIYGPQAAVPVPADAPPMFVAQAFDDPLFKTRGFPLIEAWQAAKRPVELHVYQKGSHGFGTGIAGTTTTMMLEEFGAWLQMLGFAGAPSK